MRSSEESKRKIFEFQRQRGKEIWSFLSKTIDVNKVTSVLEIGTGAGGILKTIQEVTDNRVTLKGIDLGKEYLEFGKIHGLNLQQVSSQELCETEAHSYDVIILSHVFEHFTDIKRELLAVRKLLRKEGYLYLEVPGIKNISNMSGDFLTFLQNAHVRSFTLDTLTQVMRWNGFRLVGGNEKIQSLFVYTGKKSSTCKNYYSDVMNTLKKVERKNFWHLKTQRIVSNIKKLV